MKAGDIVTIKSGGPPLTIERVYTGEPPVAICIWFEGGELRQATIRCQSLKEYVEPMSTQKLLSKDRQA